MLNVKTKFYNGIMFIKLEGTLDKSTVSLFDSEVFGIIKENKIKNIILNFSDLEDIDKYGINILEKVIKTNKRNDGKSLICNSNNYLEKKLKKFNLLLINNELVAFEEMIKC